MENKETSVNVYSNRSGSNITFNMPNGHKSWHGNENTSSGLVYGEKYPGLGKYEKVYDKNGNVISEVLRGDTGKIIREWKK